MRTLGVAGPVEFAVVAVALLAGLPPSRPAIGLLIERVSLSSTGQEGDRVSHSPALSADGRVVAFVSAAATLAPGNPNGVSQIFVHHRETRTTELVSVSSAGVAGDGDSATPAVSFNGRYVAFESRATNLVAGDTNGLSDVFVHDRATGVTERVSVDTAGSQSNGPSFAPTISYFLAEGRYVAFESRATNLVAGDTNGRPDIFVRDRLTARTERISAGNGGVQANGDSLHASISADGRYVAFTSDATNLVAGDTNLALDVFVRDRLALATTRVSVDAAGVQGNAASFFGVISADGLVVGFLSRATNLVPGTTPGVARVFVRGRQGGSPELVSMDTLGTPAANSAFAVSVSADGSAVAFDSIASNLVAGDDNQVEDIFLHARATGSTERLSINAVGNEGNDDSDSPSISADGHSVAFASTASNLVAADANAAGDVFLVTDCSRAVCGDGTLAFGCEPCDDGNTVAGDGCSGTCQTELIRGGGPKRSDCVQEWVLSPPAQLTAVGSPATRITCRDDDPSCDFGVAPNDTACTFHVALCFNVAESRFACTPSTVARVELTRPAQERPRDATDTANRDALETALRNVGGQVHGECSLGRRGAACVAPSDCDTGAGTGDGYCRGRFVTLEPALEGRTRCTPLASIKVPRRSLFQPGERILRLVATPASVPGAPPLAKDRDSLRLRCLPPQSASRAAPRESEGTP